MNASCRVVGCLLTGTTGPWGHLCGKHLASLSECAGCGKRDDGPAQMESHLKKCWPQTVDQHRKLMALARREGKTV